MDGYVTSTCLWIHVTSTCAWLCYRENVCEYVKLPLHTTGCASFYWYVVLYGLVIMFYRQCFFLSVLFSFPFFSPFTGVSIHFVSETVVSFGGFLCD